MIKLGNNDITLKVGSNDVSAAYLGSTLVYSGGTPPSFDGKWLATYSDSHTESAQCDASSAITGGEIDVTDLVSAEIGDCVTIIASQAFFQCSSLTEITIGSGITSIGESAFEECTSLTSITIPSNVTSIGSWAFRDCDSLTSVTVLAATPPTLERSNAFGGTNDCPIYVPAASVDAYKEARAWTSLASRIQAIP